jgi:transglutaminase-like putative cysteine protease
MQRNPLAVSLGSLVTLSALGALPFLSACAGGPDAPEGPDTHTDAPAESIQLPAERLYTFTYSTTVPVPDNTETLEVWLPVPSNESGVQSVLDLQVKAPDNYSINTEPVHGNRMLHVRVSKPGKELELGWTAKIRRQLDKGQGDGPMREVYLQPNKLIPIDGPALELAQKLGVMSDDQPLRARARAIYDDVLNDMQYDKAHEGWGMGSFEHATVVCKGNCTDFHSRFIGVGRAAGIPVRFSMGIPMKPKPSGTYNSYHCWAHYYDGRNWHPVDISEADKVALTNPAKANWFFGHLDADRLSLSYGRDLMLEPQQQSGPLNYFVFPHAEADGKKIEMGKKDWLFTYENL